jgi:F0F1-type ATP synthase alpha subunit
MPLFLADNDMVYIPTARHVWDQLLTASVKFRSILDFEVSQTAFAKLQNAAVEHGKPIYEELLQERRDNIAREREKADYAFAARRKTLGRIGLPQVRDYRLNLLAQEERNFQEQLNQKTNAYPDMAPLLVIRVEGGAHE